MSALWVPFEVADFERSADHYGRLLALPVIDHWKRPGEQGAVYDAGGGRVEIVQTTRPTRPPGVALELPDRPSVDAVHLAAGPAAETTPATFPRGHYGFVLADPDGNRVLVWTEA
ncbi:catechol 2,3-dioxygenase-like lactoylglutathione lyase family enzyme [Hamadaea flava]|uniref:VOC family protein n=1 Tax=Hamadaea flava TaxID=1742688 RepID=A0ABV8LW63_9ACTN|nr:VOC family protein [Hamadaea flava]MCP2327657.1 catechol 2,3-dioxygenase-like lactoylglutathione lyase family enzyme [Hamadaea flava]